MSKHWSDKLFCINCCGGNADDVEQERTGNLNSPQIAEDGRKAATQDTEDDKKRQYKEAWIFYGKMFSHFSGIIFIILIVIALLYVYIGLLSTANAARNALF